MRSDKEKLSEETATRIIRMIQDGCYKPGDKLPPERDLAACLYVSRTTVREAIRSLRTIGYIRSTQGGGNYVCDFSLEKVIDPLSKRLMFNRGMLIDIVEVRKLLECETARLAAININDSTKKRIQEAMEQMEEEVKSGKLGVEGDSAFHNSVAIAAGNDALRLILEMCCEVLNATRQATLEIGGQGIKTLEDHKSIADAIFNSEPDKAILRMAEHLDKAMDNIKINK